MRRSTLACFLGSLWCTVVDWTTKSLTCSKVVACILVKLCFSFLVTLLSCIFLLELFREDSSEPSSSWSIVNIPDSRNCVFTILSLASGMTHTWLGIPGARCIRERMSDKDRISYLPQGRHAGNHISWGVLAYRAHWSGVVFWVQMGSRLYSWGRGRTRVLCLQKGVLL